MEFMPCFMEMKTVGRTRTHELKAESARWLMLFICPFIGRGAGPGFVVMRVLEEGTAKFLFRYWSVSSSSSRRATS